MTGPAGNPDGPENVDAAFAEIVAGLQRDGVATQWPEDTPEPDDRWGREAESREGDTGEQWAADSEEHYVPPDPPPFPRPHPMTVVAVGLLLIGAVLLLIPNAVGLGTPAASPLALIALVSGAGWLLLRMRHGPPSEHDGDDGAQL
ncbi:MAG: DUF308 domain-containing protein [Kutzneria sp.]|nr:DUF308 domain-containing protein [Kutzneria sp.]